MDTKLDPLRNSELHRALAFARARETYPGIPGDLLLELCDAAWQRAAGDTRDGGALERFERALDVVARSYRVGGGRLSISEVAADAIPLAALQPYIDAQKRRPAPVEPEPVAVPARRTLTDKLSRMPRIAPAPLGVSLAAGIFGVTAAAQAGVLEQTPLAPLSFTDHGDSPAPASQAASGSERQAESSGGSAGGGSSAAGDKGPASSSWVGELAASQTAADGAAPAPAGEAEAAAPAAPPPAAPLDLASSTGAAPVATAPAPVATAPAAPAAPSVPAVRVPTIHVEVGDDEQSEEQSQDEQQESAGSEEQTPVGVHFPNIKLPGGVTVEIPQHGAGHGQQEHGEEQEQGDEQQQSDEQEQDGEEVSPDQQLAPGEGPGEGEEDAPEAQLPGEDEVGEQVPEEEMAEQPLPPEEQPEGVSERVAVTPPAAPAATPPPAPAPPPAAPATPPAAATPPAPAAPAPPAQPEAPAPTAPPA